MSYWPCSVHHPLQLLFPGPPAAGSRQRLPQTGQGQERAFPSLLRLPSSQPCLTGGYVHTYVHAGQSQDLSQVSAIILNRTVPSSPTPHPHPTYTLPTPHPHPANTSPGSPTPHPHSTHTSPTFHPHLTHIPPTPHPHSTHTSPTFHPHLTHTHPTLYAPFPSRKVGAGEQDYPLPVPLLPNSAQLLDLFLPLFTSPPSAGACGCCWGHCWRRGRAMDCCTASSPPWSRARMHESQII